MITAMLEGLDPFSHEFQQDPFPYYAAMRETSAAWNLPGTDLHFVTRYDLATTILRDTATFSSAYGATANEPPEPHLVERLEAIRRQGWDRPPTMLTVDPPDHTRYRQTVSKAFNAQGDRRAETSRRGDRRRGDRQLHRRRGRQLQDRLRHARTRAGDRQGAEPVARP